MPTGGVDLDTLESFVSAGACAVGLGSALVEKQAVLQGDFERIRSLAEAYVSTMSRARAQSAG
jgi:2-dehydro-3-deoxyphosphogluconate aldolase/(4S)-4-hydroxy-2-oxoglutarate aldolase